MSGSRRSAETNARTHNRMGAMMNSAFTTSLKVSLAIAALSVAGCATDTPQSTGRQLSATEATFTNFRNDPEMAWFRNNVKNARAVVISPGITRAGFILGGSGGEAIVIARDKATGDWVGPAFYSMGTASVGLLAGVDVSEVVILVMKEKALDGLLSSEFKVGGDASVAAGPVGVGTSGTVNADMISFSRSKGVFAGLSLEGAVIKPDSKANAAFYGREVSPADILVRRGVSSAEGASLRGSVAAAAR